MIGEELPGAGSLVFQVMLSEPDHSTGAAGSERMMPFELGPRHAGNSAAWRRVVEVRSSVNARMEVVSGFTFLISWDFVVCYLVAVARVLAGLERCRHMRA